MGKISVIIVDNHPAIRESIKTLMLNEDSRFELLKEFENGLEVIPYLILNKPDVILLDINMPKMNGIETLRKIRDEFGQEQKVIIFTGHDEKFLIYELFKLKVNGVVFKDSMMSTLREVIIMVHNGTNCFPEAVTKLFPGTADSYLDELSASDLKMIKLICDEHTTEEIADIMCASIHSVNQYRSKLLKKTNSKNIAGIVRYAIKNGICT
jgi:DNA-binding NarL/FixJ family response regulator